MFRHAWPCPTYEWPRSSLKTPTHSQTYPRTHIFFLPHSNIVYKVLIGQTMDTEEFSFPRISDTCAHNIDSPPLWNLSPAASPNPYYQGNKRGENECFGAKLVAAEVHRKSFSCVENSRKRFGLEEDEDRMDMLWEDFNEELYSTTTTVSATSSLRELRYAPALTVAKTNNSSLFPTKNNKPSMVVIVRVMRKLFSINNSQGKSRNRAR
ncbi:hypothetical protein HKD37_16G046033 [Glycine soja]